MTVTGFKKSEDENKIFKKMYMCLSTLQLIFKMFFQKFEFCNISNVTINDNLIFIDNFICSDILFPINLNKIK